MDTPTILPILKKIPLFADLTETEHKEIINNIVMNYLPAGHVFFREGDVAANASMYIIKNGMVKISRKDAAGAEQEVAVLSKNEFFGEMGLVLNDPRNASAVAIAECEIFELKKADFIKLMESSPNLANKISTEFVDRVKKNNAAHPNPTDNRI